MATEALQSCREGLRAKRARSSSRVKESKIRDAMPLLQLLLLPTPLQAYDSKALVDMIQTLALELLRLIDLGVRRRQRRLQYAQRLASKLQSSNKIATAMIVDT
jgi:hypothetical protein